MNRVTLILTLMLSLVSFPSLGVDFDDLVERNGLFYEKLTDVPFTGKVTGTKQGFMKKGKREGEWKFYYGDNVLKAQGPYEQGKQNGTFTIYYDNAQVLYKGNYIHGAKEGRFDFYQKDGTVNKQKSGIYRSGEKISD